jgi:hypothetical protein
MFSFHFSCITQLFSYHFFNVVVVDRFKECCGLLLIVVYRCCCSWWFYFGLMLIDSKNVVVVLCCSWIWLFVECCLRCLWWLQNFVSRLFFHFISRTLILLLYMKVVISWTRSNMSYLIWNFSHIRILLS